MVESFKRRGQKFIRRFSRTSAKVGLSGKEHLRTNLVERVSHIRNIRLLILEWGILILALFTLSLAQAFWLRDSYAVQTFVDGGSYVEATIGRVNSMNPLFATTNSEKALSRLMFATLTTNDFTGNSGPGLAEKLVASEDGKVWTMKLREGLKWSDGEALTNDDVIFTINLIKDPVVNSVYSTNLKMVEVSMNEAGEIVFTLPSPYVAFSSVLEFPIVPKHKLENVPLKTLVEDDFSINPVTSGAFSFNARQILPTGDEEVIYLARNPYYYLGETLLDSFAIRTFGDKDALIRAMNSGAVTGTAELSGPEVSEISLDSFVEQKTSLNTGVFMFFNTSRSPLNNKSLRAAIRKGINLELVRESVPDVAPLDYPFIDSCITLSKYPEIPKYDFNVARQQVDEIMGGALVDLNIATVNSGYLPLVADSIKNQLAALGFGVNVYVYNETQDFIANIISNRSYDILIYDTEFGEDPDLLPYYHSSQARATGLNLSNYSNAIVDNLLVAARETLNSELRIKKYETFLEYWVADTPAIGLYRSNLSYVHNQNARAYSQERQLVTALDRFNDVVNYASTKGFEKKTP
ncbi:MAG: ABC transporter substrate-binding protein [Candidatus Saccharibacteria bacterium]|nr:ABC transporter substrate-binding protein [Candidatus Saccharibacteria bacterium]